MLDLFFLFLQLDTSIVIFDFVSYLIPPTPRQKQRRSMLLVGLFYDLCLFHSWFFARPCLADTPFYVVYFDSFRARHANDVLLCYHFEHSNSLDEDIRVPGPGS